MRPPYRLLRECEPDDPFERQRHLGDLEDHTHEQTAAAGRRGYSVHDIPVAERALSSMRLRQHQMRGAKGDASRPAVGGPIRFEAGGSQRRDPAKGDR